MASVTETMRECSFCSKAEAKVKRLAAGPAALICNECLDLCRDILDELIQGGDPAWQHPTLACSFCEKSGRCHLIAGVNDYVCDECVGRFSLA